MSVLSNYPLTVYGTLASLSVYYGTILNVGNKRHTEKVEAPKTTGTEVFDNAMRVQMNTLEQLPVSLASSWLLALTSGNDTYGAVASGSWAFGRVLFWLGYPKKRSTGFFISFLSSIGAMIGTAYFVSKKN